VNTDSVPAWQLMMAEKSSIAVVLKAESALLSVPRPSFSQAEAALFFCTAQRVLRHPAFDILVARRTGERAKLVVVTPRRVGNAPQRNTVRRRIKALFHEERPLSEQYDCAIV